MARPDPAESGRDQRLHPWSWLFVMLQQLKQFIFPLVALLLFGGGGRAEGWAQLGPLVAIVVLVVLSVLQYFTYRYRVGRDGLSIRSGWLNRSLREIPFARIHNVTIHQSLLHRLFGVAEVRLESAGGQKPEAQMRVLSLADAHALEDLVRHRGNAPSREHESSAPAADTLLRLPLAEVLRLGLVSNRGMLVVAAGFGAAWQIFPDDFITGLFERYARQVYGYAAHLNLGVFSTLAAIVSLVIAGLVMTRLLSMALALTQYHGFKLSEADRRLTVERGLLARLRTSVARKRIQAWTLQESWLQRQLQRRNLRIDTAVAETQNQGEQRALKELAPIATPDDCDALIQHLLPQAQWPPQAWLALSSDMRWRLFLPSLLWVLLASAVAGSLISPWCVLLLLWLPWSWYAHGQHAARAGYAINAQIVAVRGGWWTRHWRFAEIDKLQALRLSRSPMDRRCGTASLWLDTAGATGLSAPLCIRFLPQAQADDIYQHLCDALAHRRLRW